MFFLRDQILSKLEPETYELAFQDWKNQRKQQAIDTANQILEIADNKQRFHKLKEIFRRKETNSIYWCGAFYAFRISIMERFSL